MRLCCLLSAAPHGSRCTARPCCCRGLAHPARGMLQPCRMLCPGMLPHNRWPTPHPAPPQGADCAAAGALRVGAAARHLPQVGWAACSACWLPWGAGCHSHHDVSTCSRGHVQRLLKCWSHSRSCTRLSRSPSMAAEVKYVWPIQQAVTDFGAQRQRLKEVRRRLGWRLLGCDLIECYEE